MATVVSVINLKGGVGKSTLTMVLGEYLAFRESKRVLLIDMDAQANLSYCMVAPGQISEQERKGRTIYHLFQKALTGQIDGVTRFITTPPLAVSNVSRNAMAVHDTPLHIVVSTPSVAQLDEDLLEIWEAGGQMPSDLRGSLAEALRPALPEYDYVLIDCPPGLSLFSSAALIASDYYVSPVIPEPLSLEGVGLVQRRVNNLRSRYEAQVKFGGTILNVVKHYRKTHSLVAENIYNERSPVFRPFRYWLPDSERLRKLGEYDPDAIGDWAMGEDRKFPSLIRKYESPSTLTNPREGALSREADEGLKYRLARDRIGNLVEEFMARCPETT